MAFNPDGFNPDAFKEAIVVGSTASQILTGVDVDFSGFYALGEQVGSAVVRRCAFRSGGDRIDRPSVLRDMNLMSAYLVAKRCAETLCEQEQLHTKFTSQLVNTKIKGVEPLVLGSLAYGTVDVEGSLYSIRDVRSELISAIVRICHFAHQDCDTSYGFEVNGDVAQLDALSSRLKFNSAGDLVFTRQMKLSDKVAALARAFLGANITNTKTKLSYVHEVLECCTQRDLSRHESRLLQFGVTRAQIDQLYGEGERITPQEIVAYRAIFNNATMRVVDGRAIDGSIVKACLGRAAACFGKWETDFCHIIRFISLPKYEGGSVAMLVNADVDAELVRSRVKLSERDVGTGCILQPLVYTGGRNVAHVPIAWNSLLQLVISKSFVT